MKLKKKYFFVTSIAMSLLLGACMNEESETSTTEEKETVTTEESSEATSSVVDTLDYAIENEGTPIEGGVLKTALIADSAWEGIIDPHFAGSANDFALMEFMQGSLLKSDANKLLIGQEAGAAADIEFNEEAKTVTLTLRDDVKWHDGEPLTADDILFSYEIVAHPDYDGLRYGELFENIVGVEEYKAGEADTIEGITVSEDNLSITIQYKNFGPQMYSAGGGVWANAAPRHYLKDIPVADLASSPEIREKPLGFGPFKVSNIVPGDSVQYERFDDYYLGKPKLDGVTMERIPISGSVEALRAGQIDWVRLMPNSQYENFKDGIPGYTLLGVTEQAYEYLGFKTGKFEDGEVKYNPEAKMADKSLRQAMAYALDIDAVNENFFNGIRERATTPIPKNFKEFHNDSLEGYPYDPDKANALLDEAGYEWDENKEYRLTPEGEPLEITFAGRIGRLGAEISESIANHFIQRWKEVGLNVSLLEGRLHEVNSFFERVEGDDEKIDVFEAGITIANDPTPLSLYGPKAAMNYPRWVNPKNTELLEELVSEESLDLEHRTDVFHEWQEFFMEEIPALPIYWNAALSIVNNRVSLFHHGTMSFQNIEDHEKYGLHNIQLLAEEPLTE